MVTVEGKLFQIRAAAEPKAQSPTDTLALSYTALQGNSGISKIRVLHSGNFRPNSGLRKNFARVR